MSSSDPFEIPDTDVLSELLPAYEIEAFIAAGGMGVVYRANQKSLDRPVALKILPRELGEDPDFRESFQTEARAMARLNHPNLISVYDCGEVDGLFYIAMEYVDGNSLFESAHDRAIDPDQAADIILNISAGIAHAHAAGIIHRDIKPANILLNREAVPKIGDFGLACRMEAAPGLCMGTPGYVAPEVMAAPETADKRSDIFAVGVILHELLTGLLPEAAGGRPPSAMAKVNAVMDRICGKATHPDPDQRYADISALIHDLSEWKAHHGVRLAVPSPPRRAVPRPGATRPRPVVRKQSSNMALRMMIIVLLLGAVAFTWNTLERKKRDIAEAGDSGTAMPSGQAAEPGIPALPDPEESAGDPGGTAAEVPPPEDPPAQVSTPDTGGSYPAGVWFNVEDRANLLVFHPDKTCRSLRGRPGTWSWTSAPEGGVWEIRWDPGIVVTFRTEGEPEQVIGSNDSGGEARYERLPFADEMPIESFLGKWALPRTPNREWMIEGDGKARWLSQTDEGRSAAPEPVTCTWRRGPNGNQITVFWQGNERWFNVFTLRDGSRTGEWVNQRNERALAVRAELFERTTRRTDLTTLFPSGSKWEGNWTRNGEKDMAVTGIVSEAKSTEARLVLSGAENSSWTCIIRATAGGRPEIAEVRVGGESRYSEARIPGGFPSGPGSIRFAGTGTRKLQDRVIQERVSCELTMLSRTTDNGTSGKPPVVNAAAPAGNQRSEADWKAKAAADFPALADPKSLLSRTVKDLNGRKGADYRANPDWPYRLAREAAISLLPNRSGRHVPEDAVIHKGSFFCICTDVVDWKAARDHCKRRGGRLAVIPNEETNTILAGLAGRAEVWIGASDERSEGAWEWVDGRPISYQAFLAGEPNNRMGRENFLSLKNGRWNDLPLQYGGVSGFICEWPSP